MFMTMCQNLRRVVEKQFWYFITIPVHKRKLLQRNGDILYKTNTCAGFTRKPKQKSEGIK